MSESNNISVSITEAYERGKVDINFFSALCMPSVCVFPLPPFYLAIFSLLTTRNPEDYDNVLRFALGLPRGHAKTTFIKILITYLIVYDRVKFVLIICSNGDLADLLLGDIHDILCSPNITAIYGEWEGALAIDAADTKKAAYHNKTVSIIARGWAAGVRGINLQNERPDLIFCDDAQTRKNDESPTERASLLSELVGTVFKAIAPTGPRTIIYVGNMYSEECILNKFKNSPYWTSMVTGAILENGQPLWPSLFSLASLRESYEHDESMGLAHIWFAEVMNDPKSSTRTIFPNNLPSCDIEDIVECDGSYITIDPAGFRLSSDDNVIVAHQKFNQKGYIVEHVKGILDPKELIQKAIEMALRWNCSLIAVESVAYQQTLGFWINHFLVLLGITHITVVEVSPHGRSKESRIRQFIAELYAETYYIKDPATRRDFTWQASLYKLGNKINRDDLLDACAYGLDVRNDYWHLLTSPTRTNVYDGKCRVVNNNYF